MSQAHLSKGGSTVWDEEGKPEESCEPYPWELDRLSERFELLYYLASLYTVAGDFPHAWQCILEYQALAQRIGSLEKELVAQIMSASLAGKESDLKEQLQYLKVAYVIAYQIRRQKKLSDDEQETLTKLNFEMGVIFNEIRRVQYELAMRDEEGD